jgi:thiamine-phosphate pyrophosphorylase
MADPPAIVAWESCQTCCVSARCQRLEQAHLYLVCDAQPDAFLHVVLEAGVDLVQLRMKDAADQEIVATARRFGAACARYGALLILNDRPDLVPAAQADGVHVGQDDMSVHEARALIGAERLVGLSTHTRAQIDSAAGVDYIGVGPVYETPTKPGRPAVGLELVRYAAAHAHVPFFAIGGISTTNVDAVRAAGARRVAVVRALSQAPDPGQAAARLKEALSGRQHEEVGVGST